MFAIVDDDAEIVDSVTMLLESHGWEATGYVSGDALLAKLAEGVRFECVLLDPHLDGVPGPEVARRLRAADIPFVVLTARPDSEVTVATVAAGAKAVITKPARAEELVAEFESLLRAKAR